MTRRRRPPELLEQHRLHRGLRVLWTTKLLEPGDAVWITRCWPPIFLRFPKYKRTPPPILEHARELLERYGIPVGEEEPHG